MKHQAITPKTMMPTLHMAINNTQSNDELPKWMIEAVQNKQTDQQPKEKCNKTRSRTHQTHVLKTPKTMTPTFHILNDQ